MAPLKNAGLVFVLLLTLPLAVRGQAIVIDDDEDFIPSVPRQESQGSVKKKPPSEDRPGKEADNEPKVNPRLQKLKAISFDRRPSAILKAWSSLEREAKLAQETKEREKKYPVVSVSSLGLAGSSFGQGSLLGVGALIQGEVKYIDPLDLEIAALTHEVTLGKWDAVKAYFAKLTGEEAKAGYGHLLQSLTSNRPEPGVHPQMMQFMERNKFSADDVLGLAAAAPHGLDKDAINPLGAILGQALGSGTLVEHFVARLKANLAENAKQPALSRRQAAQILLGAGQGVAAGEFLPALEQAIQDKDHEGLNLLARHFLAMHQKEPKGIHLENAWKATQSTLATGNVKAEDQEKAVKQAVELAPRIREELGQAWLDESFSIEPQRGMDILATIGAGISKGLTTYPRETDLRLKSLQLQKTAVSALLKAAPQRAAEWRKTLTLLAGNWLREAEFSHQHDRSAGLSPGLRRDPYGNFFYMDDDEPMPQYMMMQQRENMPQPIRVGPLLETRPEEAWLELIDIGVQPKMSMVFAQLYLKVNEEALAFPFLEKLATTHPDKTRPLAKEFLQVWTRNHDQNASRSRMNRYMYMYSFETRAETIPLTRSKQERNLLELAQWVERLRGLNIGEIDEKTLTKAFTACHSSAEVYRLEALEKVFGSIGALKPLTLAGMGQQMRENLGGLWRDPAVQKDKKTNRKSKDIQAEVVRGYAVAQAVLDKGLEKYPDHWALYLASAALRHDENNYQQELNKTSQFSAQRAKAMTSFQKAAQLYAAQAKGLAQDEETTQVFEQWLYASLGACDLKNINEDKLPDSRQPALIKQALLSLPQEAADRHMSTFANTLFTRLSAVNPAVKYRYLKAGLEIVGDHKMALEARKVFDYYKDLITEIKLDTTIDGNDMVGHQQPFGVFVNLRHTREIERESGGFGRYLQNQNSSSYFSYNYGRPTADYRDKFQAAATEALKEHFDVLSITFQTDKVNSRALPEYGWRYTPYAYLLLKPRGPQVDKVPSVRLDLDFLETSGYVVLPIESPTLPIDAGTVKAPVRPLHKLQVSQILDERQADKGKLVLEVKATALGLVPELDKILTLEQTQFEIDKSTDQGVSVVRFDPDSEQNAVVSERSWLISFKAKADLSKPANLFRFGIAKVEGAELTYQRYQDADLANAEPEVSLEQTYGKPSQAWIYWLIGGVLAAIVVILALVLKLRRVTPKEKDAWKLPENLTPFTVLAFLKEIEHANGIKQDKREELAHSIALVERHYFGLDGEVKPDLKSVAEDWLRRAN